MNKLLTIKNMLREVLPPDLVTVCMEYRYKRKKLRKFGFFIKSHNIIGNAETSRRKS